MMNVVMRKNAFANQEGDWSRQIIVHELVHYAYRSRASSITNALSVLHTIFRQREISIPALWVVLQQCTKLWCGEELNGDNVAESIHTRAGALAELVKVVVLTLPRTILVGSELAYGVLFLPVVQVAVCPLAPIHRDQTRMVQLQILKTLCTRLTSIRHHPVASKGFSADADWRRCMELICTERVQYELRLLVKETSRACNGVYRKVACHRASIVLAQSILAFTRRLRQATP
ncbi:hypothetical protein PsorP6_003544 [Peronosclerospora sorghi]|uniref:Uncharacterized protein n=1 Tax=Peronosclerospora sorghi TaxID=230839 RepID=A0ACC0VJY3_9STRA|nr:hypothetical protein PsorP6_003544 [Peronosclerospora sorghi]